MRWPRFRRNHAPIAPPSPKARQVKAAARLRDRLDAYRENGEPAAPIPQESHAPKATALDVLLAELDRNDAAGYARDIRRDGEPAIRKGLADCAAHVLRCKAFLTSTAVIAAFAAYDLAANGTDWRAIPHELVRARGAASAAQDRLGAAMARAQAAGQRRAERVNARALAAIRSGGGLAPTATRYITPTRTGDQ